MHRYLLSIPLVAGCTLGTPATVDSANITATGGTVTGCTPIVDAHIQQIASMVDVLFVIDHSATMDAQLANLADQLPTFLNAYVDSNVDYHIGFVTTDMSDPGQSGILTNWIDNTTPNPFELLSGLPSHSDDRAGRAAVYTALAIRNNAENAGFLRPNSDLHLVVLSDGDDESDVLPIDHEEFQNWLNNEKLMREEVSFSVFAHLSPPAAGAEAVLYQEVTNAVGGLAIEIDDPVWRTSSQRMGDLGLLTTGYQQHFDLSEVPIAGTLEIEVHHDGIVYQFDDDDDFEYISSTNEIRFLEFVPWPQAEVLVSYCSL